MKNKPWRVVHTEYYSINVQAQKTVKRKLNSISSPETYMLLFVAMMNIYCVKEILDISSEFQFQ